MSSRSHRQKKTRRSSSILKKAISDENDATSIPAVVTQVKNPSQKRLSKRVSFADANQINVIARVEDIHQNWQDSVSDSSDAGISALCDVSNLTTPNIKKAQIQQSSENTLQNLLKSAIMDGGKNMNNKTQGFCAVGVSSVSSAPKFSFFDNSKLGIGDECTAEASDNPEDKENNALVTSFYTKDFLRSLQLDESDEDHELNFTEKQQQPHINPPSYQACIKGAGRKSDVPAIKADNPLAEGTVDLEDMDFTVQSVGRMQTVVNSHAGSLSPLTEGADMELTCPNILGMQKVAESEIQSRNTSPEIQSQNISPFTDPADMELTCAFPNAKEATEIQARNIIPPTDCVDMEFTCAIQGGLKPPTAKKENCAEKPSPCNDPGDMEFTCVLQPQNALSAQTGFTAEIESSAIKKSNTQEDDMDFTCAVTPINMFTEKMHEQLNDSGQMDITECNRTNLNKEDSSNIGRSAEVLCETDGGVDFTRVSCKVGVNFFSSSTNAQTKQRDQQDHVSNGSDMKESAYKEIKDVQTGANEDLEVGEKTVMFDHSTGDMDLTLGDIGLGLAKGTYVSEEYTDKMSKSNCADISPATDVQHTTASSEEHSKFDFQKSVTKPAANTVNNYNYAELAKQNQKPQDANLGVDGVDISEKAAPALPSGGMEYHPGCQESKQEEEDIAAPLTGSRSMLKATADDCCETTLNTSDDMEEPEFASPLKKRLHKIRNSIGLYKAKAMQNYRPEKRSGCLESLDTVPDSSSGNTDLVIKRLKSSNGRLAGECQDEISTSTESKVPDTLIDPADCIFVPDSQSEPAKCAWNPELSQIPESQNMECQSPMNEYQSGSREETAGTQSGKESEEEKQVEIGCHENLGTPLTHECETDAGEAVPSQSGDKSSYGLSVSLHKSLMDDICQELSLNKEENITVQEFLSVYAEINMGNLKKSRHSIVVPSVKVQPVTTLREIFGAKFWTPREVATREACVELMRKKIEWLEDSVSSLEEQFHASNPVVFQSIRNDPDENSELLTKLQKLATNCKSLGNVYWKRDAMKLHKGLNRELNTYVNENLLPISQELKPCKELFEKALEEMEKGDGRPDETALQKPTAEQNAMYIESKAELDRLKTRHQEMLEKVESVDERKDSIRKRRTELTNKLMKSDFTFGESVKRLKHESLSQLEKSSLYELKRVDDSSLVFSFLSNSITFTASFEESLSWEWTRKITSFSLETDRKAGEILPFEASFYMLIHKLWRASLPLTHLVTEYSNLAGLKNMLEVLTNLVRACHDLLDDKNWINCRLVCECSICADEASITVSFLSPQPGVDGFAVKFVFDDSPETKASQLDRILSEGFSPTSRECIMGKRCLDYLGKKDLEVVLNNLEPGPHYLKRAVDALLKKIEYKHWD